MKKIYIAILIIIFIIFFLFFYYKNSKLGNTIINLSEEKVIENILSNKFNYKAEIKVNVYSNKNKNEYKLKIMENGKNSLLEVVGKNSISGLKIEKKNEDLIVTNSNLGLDKIYEKYKEMTDSSLFLTSFSKEYNESKKKQIVEKNNEVLIKITIKDYNKYIKYKELYLNKKTGMPIKLIVKDSNNQIRISIKYTSIEIL